MSKTAADAICQFIPPFVRYLREGLAKVNISPARFQVLETLKAEGALTMVELADHLSVTKRNITSLIDGLEKEGLAERNAHPTDRRATLVRLTKAGDEAFVSAARVQFAHLQGLFAELDEGQKAEMVRSLSILTDALAEQRKSESNG